MKNILKEKIQVLVENWKSLVVIWLALLGFTFSVSTIADWAINNDDQKGTTVSTPADTAAKKSDDTVTAPKLNVGIDIEPNDECSAPPYIGPSSTDCNSYEEYKNKIGELKEASGEPEEPIHYIVGPYETESKEVAETLGNIVANRPIDVRPPVSIVATIANDPPCVEWDGPIDK